MQQSITVWDRSRTAARLMAVRTLTPWSRDQKAKGFAVHANTPHLAGKGPELPFPLSRKGLVTLSGDLTLILALL